MPKFKLKSMASEKKQKIYNDIIALLWAAAGLFVALSLMSYQPLDPSFNSWRTKAEVANWCGLLGSFLADGLLQSLGASAWLLPLLLFVSAVRVFKKEEFSIFSWGQLWGVLLVMNLCAIMAIAVPKGTIYQGNLLLSGFVGQFYSRLFLPVLNPVGSQIFLLSSSFVFIMLIFEKSVLDTLPKFFAFLRQTTFHLKARLSKATSNKKKFTPPGSMDVSSVESKKNLFPSAQPQFLLQSNEFKISKPEEPQLSNPFRKPSARAKLSQKVENWQTPHSNVLEDPPHQRIKVDEKEIKRKAELLKEKLAHFQVTGEVVAARPGPAVTLFEFKPDADVKLSKITDLADDLSLALSSESLRILAPIPGRDVVGIETSNSQRETVFLKDLLSQEDFWKPEVKLPIPLGKRVDGVPQIMDLRKLPHLLVAGTTGSGKSVFVVSLLVSLLFKHSPKTLRLVLIDPKQVDLAAFEKIPHLALPLVTDSREAISSLKWAVQEMEKRYRSMSRFSARGLEAYNETVETLDAEKKKEFELENQDYEQTPGKKGETFYFQPLPYLVIVIEEFGDLMTVDKTNVEQSVVRLAQKARACGIHLVLAMQSPRKEVVTGLIKTNIPGRISFKVSSTMDSRIILDETGAERLLAQGDMLFRNPTGSHPTRFHGPFLKDQEVHSITGFWSQQGEPSYFEAAVKAMSQGFDSEETSGPEGASDGELDEKYDEILSWAASLKEVSASLIQRRFQLGYPRAARLIETFERQGVVGPANGSKPRQVLIEPFPEPKNG